MEVLLTHGYFLKDDEKEQQIMRPYVPLGILYISSYLENNGIANEVFDTTFSSKREFCEYLLQHKPPIVAIYVNLMTKVNVLESVEYIKTNLPETLVVLGGPEVRYSAENFLRYGADFIVIGEGEETTLELVREYQTSIDREKLFTDAVKNKFKNIQGLAFLHQNEFVQTSERTKMKNLDELPIPNRKKVNLHLYLDAWKHHHGTNTISVSTMRGCPYTCKWCSRGVYGLSYRRRPVQQVVEELVQLKNDYDPDSLWFVDDVFTISHKWLKEFSEELKRRNILIPYECITRADRLNDEVMQLLQQTGCFRVWIGAESGSQRVIDLMDRRVDVIKVRDMIRLSKKYGIQSGTFIMLGYPGETEEDIEETIHHLKDSDPDYFTITVAYPIKGTELYQEIEAIQTKNIDWATQTDREIEFKRTYSRKYYDFAIKRVINEVHYSKSKNGTPSLKATKFKVKSIVAKAGMWWERNSSRA